MRLLILICGISFLVSELCYGLSNKEGRKIVEDEQEGLRSFDKNQEAAFASEVFMESPTGDLFNPCPGHSTGLAGEAFADLINSLILSECVLGSPCAYPHDVGGECRSKTIFDFIVVGGGTAGAVVASRLSEQSDWNILLLEAGGDPPMTSDVPFFYASLQRTDIDWRFQTVRERGLYNGLMGKVNRWPRGKVLGGTSTMGYMNYIRGHPSDFDNIAGAGNIGWSWADVLPYYKKSEDMRDLVVLGSDILKKYHGRYGPLTISRMENKDPLIQVIQNVTYDLGQPKSQDINGINMNGFAAPNDGTVRNSERINTAKAFLNPVKRRPNLFVIKHAYVTKIHICHKTKRAYGVEYYYRTEKVSRTLRASREVIICCGSIGSPRLLLLSGIGPKNDLDDLGIFVQQNLRVGRNLQDTASFPALPITLNFDKGVTTPLDLLDYSYQYLTRRTGPLGGIGVSELVGMFNVLGDEQPDILVRFTYIHANNSDMLEDFVKNYAFDEEVALQYYDCQDKSDLLIVHVILLHAKSRGVVKLRTANPDDMPIIEGRYFDDQEDLNTIMSGIKFIEKVAAHRLMTIYKASLKYLKLPGCCGLEPGTEHYWACSLSHFGGTGFNPFGTCKMGPCEDPDAVVDHQLRVHGIKGLRVADASILPISVTSSLMATAVMIGEKVSDMVKLQWLANYHPWTTTRSPYSVPTTLMMERKNKTKLPYQIEPVTEEEMQTSMRSRL